MESDAEGAQRGSAAKLPWLSRLKPQGNPKNAGKQGSLLDNLSKLRRTRSAAGTCTSPSDPEAGQEHVRSKSFGSLHDLLSRKTDSSFRKGPGSFSGRAGSGGSDERSSAVVRDNGGVAQHEEKKPERARTESSVRVVSLLGAATEAIALMGLSHMLVGRSHECKSPASILDVPCVSSPAFDTKTAQGAEGSLSCSIDKEIKSRLERGLSRYSVDVDLIRQLAPDVIITQDACEVCAITTEDLQAACKEYFASEEGRSCRVVSLKPFTVSDIWADIITIAKALRQPDQGQALVLSLKARCAAVQQRVPLASLPSSVSLGDASVSLPAADKSLSASSPAAKKRPRVACLQWLDPLMGAGYWVPEIVVCAGGRSVTGKPGEPTKVLDLPALLKSDADVIVVMCCGLSLDAALLQLLALPDLEAWNQLRAVQNGRVYVADGDRYFNTSGPAIAESAEILLEILFATSALDPPTSPATSPQTSSSVTTPTSSSRSSPSPPSSSSPYATYEGWAFVQLPGSCVQDWLDESTSFVDSESTAGSSGSSGEEELHGHRGSRGVGGGGSWRNSSGWGQDRRFSGPLIDVDERCRAAGTRGEGAGGRGGGRGKRGEGGGQSERVGAGWRTAWSEEEEEEEEEEEGVSSNEGDGGYSASPPYSSLTFGKLSSTSPSSPTHLDDARSKQDSHDEDDDDHDDDDASPPTSSATSPSAPLTLTGLPLKVAQLRALVLAILADYLPSDCILLSGGLSSTVLAEASEMVTPGSIGAAVTVLASPRASDRGSAEAVARKCGLPQILVGGGPGYRAENLLETELRFVVRTLKTFDPAEVRSGIVLAAGLREAKRQGFNSVVVGDGADELFTLFDFMARMKSSKLQDCRQHMIEVMRFQCQDLAAALGLEVRQPFLHPAIQEFALTLLKKELMGVGAGEEWKGFNEGKLILRMAFPEVSSARRPKEAIEVGAGTISLHRYFTKKLTPEEFKQERARIKREDQVRLRDAEHLYYYRAFRQAFAGPDVPGVVRWEENSCVACGYPPLFQDQLFCSTCGEYPARKQKVAKKKETLQDIPRSPRAAKEKGRAKKSASQLSVPTDLPTSPNGKSRKKKTLEQKSGWREPQMPPRSNLSRQLPTSAGAAEVLTVSPEAFPSISVNRQPGGLDSWQVGSPSECEFGLEEWAALDMVDMALCGWSGSLDGLSPASGLLSIVESLDSGLSVWESCVKSGERDGGGGEGEGEGRGGRARGSEEKHQLGLNVPSRSSSNNSITTDGEGLASEGLSSEWFSDCASTFGGASTASEASLEEFGLGGKVETQPVSDLALLSDHKFGSSLMGREEVF